MFICYTESTTRQVKYSCKKSVIQDECSVTSAAERGTAMLLPFKLCLMCVSEPDQFNIAPSGNHFLSGKNACLVVFNPSLKA